MSNTWLKLPRKKKLIISHIPKPVTYLRPRSSVPFNINVFRVERIRVGFQKSVYFSTKLRAEAPLRFRCTLKDELLFRDHKTRVLLKYCNFYFYPFRLQTTSQCNIYQHWGDYRSEARAFADPLETYSQKPFNHCRSSSVVSETEYKNR